MNRGWTVLTLAAAAAVLAHRIRTTWTALDADRPALIEADPDGGIPWWLDDFYDIRARPPDMITAPPFREVPADNLDRLLALIRARQTRHHNHQEET